MKKTLLFITALALTVLTLVTSCQKDLFHFVKGTPVKFGITSSGSSLTRAAYSNEDLTGKTVQRIDWKKNDRIRIYCKASSDVEEERYADYKVTEDSKDVGSPISSATVVSYDGKELCWGTSTDPHTFYAVYPSPGFPCSVSPGITVSIADNVVTGNLPSTDQGKKDVAQVPMESGNYVVTPDLKWMMMTAKAGPYTDGIPDDEGTVFLSFQPLTTAIEFTIYNGDKTKALPVNKVKLISESTQISGTFTVDISTLDDSYYPTCTGTMEDSKEVCIDMSALGISLAKATGDKTENCKSLTFTFFLAPITDVSDLTFQIYTSDTEWKKTRLKYTDGSGVEFPCHKKTLVKGLLVPEGAQWTVKYDPDVEPWNQSKQDIDPSPEVGGKTFVTSWDTESGIEADLELKFSYQKLEVENDVQLDYEGGSSVIVVDSDSPWKFQYKNADGDWVDVEDNELIDNWIKFSPAAGIPTGSAVNVNVTVSQCSEQKITTPHSKALREAAAKGTADAPYDLSTHDIYGNQNTDGKANTANCYVISSPGWYAFPLVYGNAIKNGEDNKVAYAPTSATYGKSYVTPFAHASGPIETPYIDLSSIEIVSIYWEDVAEYALIAEDGLTLLDKTQAAAKGLTACDCGYMMFEVKADKLCQGNALLAAVNSAGAVWSWHIWVTDLDLTTISTGTANLMPCYLGSVFEDNQTTEYGYDGKVLPYRVVQMDGSEVMRSVEKFARRDKHVTSQVACTSSSPTWQWGRKDPMMRFVGSSELSTSGLGYINDTKATGVDFGIIFSVQHPERFIQYNDASNNWYYENDYDYNYLNLWSATNTTYGEGAIGYDEIPVKTVYDPCPPGFVVMSHTSIYGGEKQEQDSDDVVVYKYPSGQTMVFPVNGYRSKDGKIYVKVENKKVSSIWAAAPNSAADAYRCHLSSGLSNSDCQKAYAGHIIPMAEK